MFCLNTDVLYFCKKVFILFWVLILFSSMLACQKETHRIECDFGCDYELKIEGEITLTVNSENGTSGEEAAIHAFEEKYPGVKVVIEKSDIAKYTKLIAAGEIGDVFWCNANDAITYKRKHSALLMLDYYFNKLNIDIANVYNGAYQSGIIDGHLYMIPTNFQQQVMIYNTDAITKAGISLPVKDEAITWEYFRYICRELTLYENSHTVQVGASFKLWQSDIWQAFAIGWGGTWCDADNKTVSFVSDEKVMRGINEMFEICTEGWMTIEDIDYPADHGTLADYQHVFRNFSDIQLITEYGSAYDNNNINWDFCPFPALPTHKVCADATGYVVYNRTRNYDTAIAFALFFLTEDGQRAYYSAEDFNVPSLKSLANETFWKMPDTNWSNKNFDAFISYPDAVIPANVATIAPIEIAEILSDSNMKNKFQEIIHGTKSVEDVFTELENTCNETWSTLKQL